jgi:hypothetical protein
LALWAVTVRAFSKTPRGNRVLLLNPDGYGGQAAAAADAIAQGITTTSIHLHDDLMTAVFSLDKPFINSSSLHLWFGLGETRKKRLTMKCCVSDSLVA